MITYTLKNDLQCRASILADIAVIDQIIRQLLQTALTASLNGDTLEYTLDTGQTKINKIYNSPAAMHNAVKEWQKTRQMYASMLSSRVVRLVDSKNFNNGSYGR